MKLYRVKLTPEERAQLLELLSKGKWAARTLTHARILLKTDEGVAGPRLSDEAIAESLDVNRSTVERIRIRWVEETFGPIDIWINVAMASVFSPVKEMKPEEYKRCNRSGLSGIRLWNAGRAA